ncbi:MAG: hypothetical protein ACR2IM_05620 [Sediminibacterium sp.]
MKLITLYTTILLFFFTNSSAQNSNADKFYYASIDKELYLPDENVWFKIYVHSPLYFDTTAYNIYVDLVDPNNKIIEHQVYLTFYSSINGQIKIPRNYPFSQVNLVVYQKNDKKEKINYYQKEIAILNKALIARTPDSLNSNKINPVDSIHSENPFSIHKTSNEIIVQVNNEKKNFDEIYFSIKNQKDTLVTKYFKIGDKRRLTIKLPKEQFSTGYYLFELSNANDHLLFQEWVYNLSTDHLLNPVINLDTLSFDKDGKNVWRISNLPNSNLNISIVDADLPATNKNIASELLFNSVNNKSLNHISSYFTNLNLSNEIIFDSIIKANKISPIPFRTNIINDNDDYLAIKGRIVRTTKKNVPLPKNLNIVLGGPNKKTSFIQAPINVDSSFILNKLIFYDTIYAKAILSNEEKNDYKVVIDQDSIYQSPTIKFIDELTPESYSFIKNHKANNLIHNAEILDSLFKKLTLKEVTVKARYDYKLNKLDEIYSFGLFSSNNAYRLDVSNDPFFQNGFDLGNYIISKIPGISYSLNFNTMMDFDASPFSWRGATTSIFLDEMKVSWDQVRDLPRNNIGYIKVFRPIFFGDYQNGTGGAIAIYTKKHFDQPIEYDKKESTLLKGYFNSNNFSDELIKMEEKLKQINTTLYWNPYFVFYDTVKNEQTIKFFNNHFTKKYLVKIEGIDNKGQVLYYEKVIQ